MTLLTQAALPLAGERPTVLEFGNQTLTADRQTLELVINRAIGSHADISALQNILALDRSARRACTRALYEALGAAAYTAIDVNELYGSLMMDLNRDLRAAYAFTDQFDFVTNSGTGEHVFDQGAIFRNMHAHTRPGGVMVHLMPFVNYINHGFYSFHPNLYPALAAANGYHLLGLGVATRDGHGMLALSSSGENVGNFLRSGSVTTVEKLITDAKVPHRAFVRRLIDVLRAKLPGAEGKRTFGLGLHRLLVSGGKILVFAVMRKADRETGFAVPIQGRYESDVAMDLS